MDALFISRCCIRIHSKAHGEVTLFDISFSNIDCQYIDNFEKSRYRCGHFENIDIDIDKAILENIDIKIDIDKAVLKISISIRPFWKISLSISIMTIIKILISISIMTIWEILTWILILILKDILENIDIDRAVLEYIDIDKEFRKISISIRRFWKISISIKYRID